MKKITIAIFTLIVIGFSGIVNAFDKTYVLSVDEFESLQINQGGITINNFSLGEKRAYMGKGLANVNISFSIRNKNPKPNVINVMLVGMSDKEVIWALDASPLMSLIAENTTDKAEADSYISPGDVKKTKKIWMRVVGDF
jgi:hypothetical protein